MKIHKNHYFCRQLPNIKNTWYDIIKSTLEAEKQLDELRTQYEVDKHIAEKQKARLRFMFAAGIGALLFVILIIWIFYSRKIHKKNVALVEQILAQEKDRNEIDKLRKIAQENTGSAAETDEIFARSEKIMQEKQPSDFLYCWNILWHQFVNNCHIRARECVFRFVQNIGLMDKSDAINSHNYLK